MLIHTLQKIYKRDLEKLKQEIILYKDESAIWTIAKGTTNSAGNLCLHLIGNLNTYIGAEIGNTGYVRNRELEFTLKNVPRTELIIKIDDTVNIINSALNILAEEDLQKEYPLLVFSEKMTTGYFLVHLAVHLGYHLGQINYHRRMQDP